MAKKNAKQEKKEVVRTKEQVYADIAKLIKSINDAFKDENLKVAMDGKTKLKGEVSIYNQMLREEEYDKFLAEENPVLSALTQCGIVQMTVKNTKIKDTDIEQVEMGEKSVVVDLVEMGKYAKHLIFASGQWVFKAEKFGQSLSMRAMKDMENAEEVKRISASYKLSKEAKEIEGRKDPLSNKSLKADAQDICDDILPGFLFKGGHLSYLRQCAVRESSSNLKAVTMPQKETMFRLMTKVMHFMVTGTMPEAEFKEIK